MGRQTYVPPPTDTPSQTFQGPTRVPAPKLSSQLLEAIQSEYNIFTARRDNGGVIAPGTNWAAQLVNKKGSGTIGVVTMTDIYIVGSNLAGVNRQYQIVPAFSALADLSEGQTNATILTRKVLASSPPVLRWTNSSTGGDPQRTGNWIRDFTRGELVRITSDQFIVFLTPDSTYRIDIGMTGDLLASEGIFVAVHWTEIPESAFPGPI